MAEHLAGLIDEGEDVGDRDDTDDLADENPWGFIPFDNGRLFIRQSEIVGMKWVQDEHVDDDEVKTYSWHLVVTVENVGIINLYGDDCGSLMRVLGLPEEHPGG